MKHVLLKFSTFLLFFLPLISFADVPGNKMRCNTAFVITNTKSFAEYTFYYSQWSDSTKIKQGKVYSFTHGGNPNTGWGIYVYAINKQSGKETVAFGVGSNSIKESITIRGIKNDTIYYDKAESGYKTNEEFSIPVSDNRDENGNPVGTISNTVYLLLGISAFSILIFSLMIFWRRRKA